MTINPMQSAHDAPRCKAKSKRTGKPILRLPCAATASVACTAQKVARRPASVTESIGTACERRGDRSSEVGQLAVTFRTEILRDVYSPAGGDVCS